MGVDSPVGPSSGSEAIATVATAVVPAAAATPLDRMCRAPAPKHKKPAVIGSRVGAPTEASRLIGGSVRRPARGSREQTTVPDRSGPDTVLRRVSGTGPRLVDRCSASRLRRRAEAVPRAPPARRRNTADSGGRVRPRGLLVARVPRRSHDAPRPERRGRRPTCDRQRRVPICWGHRWRVARDAGRRRCRGGSPADGRRRARPRRRHSRRSLGGRTARRLAFSAPPARSRCAGSSSCGHAACRRLARRGARPCGRSSTATGR